jgi:hypothetical protein
MMKGRFFRRVARETHYRDAVANFSEVRSGAIELDDSALPLAVDCISLEPLPIVQVAHENFLIGKQSNQLSQVG